MLRVSLPIWMFLLLLIWAASTGALYREILCLFKKRNDKLRGDELDYEISTD